MVDDSSKIQEVTIVYGVVDVLPKRALKTEVFLVGKEFSRETFKSALSVLEQEIQPHPGNI